MTKDEKIKILEDSIAFRERDIQERQIDIDNYILSLDIIDALYSENKDICVYKEHLKELLRTATLEQTKVKIFLEAAKVNLGKIKG